MTKNVPISDTGTSIMGSSVARQSCRKIRTTMKTSDERLEERLVDLVDRLVDEDRRVVDDLVLHALRGSAPSGAPSRARTLSAVASAFAPGSWKTAIVTDGSPSR